MRRLRSHIFAVIGCSSFLLLFLSLFGSTAAYAHQTVATHQVGSGTSQVGPTAEDFCVNPAFPGEQDQFYVYTGTDHHINIYDVTRRQNYVTIQTTPLTPAAACWHNSLVIAWRSNSDSTLYVGAASSLPGDPVDIIGPTQYTNATTDNAPTLTSNGSTMFLGWVGQDSQHHLNLLELVDTGHFSTKITFTDFTHAGGGLTFYWDQAKSMLWVTWSAADTSDSIWLGSLNGISNQLTEHGSFPDSSFYAPGIYAYNGTIDFIWKGLTNNHIYTGHWDGQWHGSIQQADTTNFAPSMDGPGTTSDTSTLITAFTGTNAVVYFDTGLYRY